MMEVVRSADGRTETRVNTNGDSPLQTGTHFPRLKNRECSSLVKQMSDAAGVLSTQRWIITHDRKKQHHTSFCNWLDAMWNSQTHHRILLKFHKCLSRSTPVTHRCDYVIYVTVWFHGRGGGICPYPRCVGHPYKTGDWTEWWGACRRASGQSGPTTPRGCGPSSSSCTLKIERLGGRMAKQRKDRKCVVQLASENVPVGSQYGVRCVSNRVQLIWLFPIILNIHLQE